MTDKDRIQQLERAYALQKRARAEAERLLEDKSRELYNKNQDLQRALEQLKTQQEQMIAQEKMASIGQLAAGLAHELNNPNAFIQNNLHALDEYLTQLLDACTALSDLAKQNAGSEEALQTVMDKHEVDYIRSDYKVLITESLRGSTRISSIANSLRYFANPDSIARRATQINDCLQQAERQLSEADLQGRLLQYEFGELPAIEGMPVLLSQSFLNIIKNALEASAADSTINIKTRVKEDQIVVTISDHGVGFGDLSPRKLFEPFFSTKEDHNGLGLTIAQSIVQQHGGSIDIARQNDCTHVSITLPVRES